MPSNPRPNLFIVGSMKSGTTSLSAYLNTHPSIFMTADPKEPTYFLEREQILDVLPGVEQRGFWRGERYYLELFAKAEGMPIIGEASANYARLHRVKGVPERVAKFNPEARIVFIMRDPVERTISHYWYMVQHFDERRGMFKAIREDPDFVDTSNYAMQLRPYLKLFGAEHVKVLTTEALRDHPQEVMHDLFRWLGVDASFNPPNLTERFGATPAAVQKVRGLGLIHRFRYSRFWNAVGSHIPPSVRGLGRALSERRVERKDVDTSAVNAYLRLLQRAQCDELRALLGRDFPEWRVLYSDD